MEIIINILNLQIVNYIIIINLFHTDKFKRRKITWLELAADSRKENNIINNFSRFENDKNEAINNGNNYIAYHSYNREYFND